MSRKGQYRQHKLISSNAALAIDLPKELMQLPIKNLLFGSDLVPGTAIGKTQIVVLKRAVLTGPVCGGN